MEEESKVRKCSSCKLLLPSHLFKNEHSEYFYKTCLPCRYKKRLKYYCIISFYSSPLATLSNVPLSKREKSEFSLVQNNIHNTSSDADTSSTTSIVANEEDASISEKSSPVIPQARWINIETEEEDHVFIASAILTPVTLDRLTGSSRKYSVIC